MGGALLHAAGLDGNPGFTQASLYVTQCKLCPRGIFIGGEAAVWLRKPLGLSHVACASRAGLMPEGAQVFAPTSRHVFRRPLPPMLPRTPVGPVIAAGIKSAPPPPGMPLPDPPVGEWHYLTGGRVTHYRGRFDGQLLALAQCGAGPLDPSWWMGTGNQAEYEQAAALPRCARCRIAIGLDRKGAAS